MYILSIWGKVREVLFYIDGVGFAFIDNVYNLFTEIAKATIIKPEVINRVLSNIYVVVGIFALFRIAMFLVMSIINPENFNKEKAGVSKIFINTVIMLALLVFTPIIFQMSRDLTTKVVEGNYIQKIFLNVGDNGEVNLDPGHEMQKIAIASVLTIDDAYELKETTTKDSSGKSVKIQECSNCGKSETKQAVSCIKAIENGDPTSKYNEDSVRKKIKWTAFLSWQANIVAAATGNAEGWLYKKTGGCLNSDGSVEWAELAHYNGQKEDIDGNSVYVFNYKPFVLLVAGIAISYVLLSFTFDIAKRMIELAVLEIISPVFIATYIDPKSSQSGPFKKWLTACGKTYASLFIRIAIISIMLLMIKLLNMWHAPSTVGGIGKLIILIAFLIFCKSAPKWLAGLIGVDGDDAGLGGLGIGKKLAGAALIGGALTKAGHAAAGLGMGAAKNLHAARKANRLNRKADGQTIGSNLKNKVKSAKGFGNKLNAARESLFTKEAAKENLNRLKEGQKSGWKAAGGGFIQGASSGLRVGIEGADLKDINAKTKANAKGLVGEYSPGYKNLFDRGTNKVSELGSKVMDSALGDSSTRDDRKKAAKDYETAKTNGMLEVGADGKRDETLSPVKASEVKKLCGDKYNPTSLEEITEALIDARIKAGKIDGSQVKCLGNGKVSVNGGSPINASEYALQNDRVYNKAGQLAMESIARENAINKASDYNNNNNNIMKANQAAADANSKILEIKANVKANFGDDALSAFTGLEEALQKQKKATTELNKAQQEGNQINITAAQTALDAANEEVKNARESVDNTVQQAGTADGYIAAINVREQSAETAKVLTEENAKISAEINEDISRNGENSYFNPSTKDDKNEHISFLAPEKAEEAIELMTHWKGKADENYKKMTEKSDQ